MPLHQRTRSGRLLLAALAGLAVWPAAVPQSRTAASAKQELLPVAQRKLAPDFTLSDLDGRKIKLSRYRSRVVLLDFWGTTCGGCKVELPWYVAFDRKYHRQGLSLIGLDMYGESAAVVRPFVTKWHMNYPVAIGTDALRERFGLKEMPLTVLIDREGRVAVSHVGIVDRSAFEHEVQQLLRE